MARRAASSTIPLGSEEPVTWRTQLVHWQIAAPSFLLNFFRTCRSTKIRLLHRMMCKGQTDASNIACFLVNGVMISLWFMWCDFPFSETFRFWRMKNPLGYPDIEKVDHISARWTWWPMDNWRWHPAELDSKHLTRPEDWLYMRYPEAWVFFGTGLEDRY